MQEIVLNSSAGSTVRACIEKLTGYKLDSNPVKYKGDNDEWFWAVVVENRIYIWKAN